MTLPSAKRLQHMLESVIHTVLEHGTILQHNDRARVEHLRFSGLPFCPVRWLAKVPVGLAPKARKPFGFAFYTRIGTAVHEVFQSCLELLGTPLPHSFELIADWKCNGCEHRVSFEPKPSKCPACGHESLRFEEHEILLVSSKTRVRAMGHVDCILRFKLKDGSYAYVVIDFKTSSVSKVNAKEFVVSAEYSTQIASYAAAITHSQGVKVLGTALVFVARDYPNAFKVHVQLVDADSNVKYLKAIHRYMRQLQVVQEATTVNDLQGIIASRPCAEGIQPEYAGCDYELRCAGSDRKCTRLLQSSLDQLAASKRLPVVSLFKRRP